MTSYRARSRCVHTSTVCAYNSRRALQRLTDKVHPIHSNAGVRILSEARRGRIARSPPCSFSPHTLALPPPSTPVDSMACQPRPTSDTQRSASPCCMLEWARSRAGRRVSPKLGWAFIQRCSSPSTISTTRRSALSAPLLASRTIYACYCDCECDGPGPRSKVLHHAPPSVVQSPYKRPISVSIRIRSHSRRRRPCSR